MPRGMDIGAAIGRAISGVGDLYQRNQAQKKQDEQAAAREKFDQLRMELEDMYRQAGMLREDRREQREDERYQQGRKDQTAAVTASTLTGDQELDPWTVGQLEGTPQEGRIGKRQTLPSRTIPETGIDIQDEGGDPFNVWQPTAAEQRGLKQDAERDTFIKGLPKRAGTAAKARTYGVPLDPEDLKTPEDLAAETEAADLHELGIFDAKERIRAGYRPPRAEAAGSKDDPELPRGVESYLYDLTKKQVATPDVPGQPHKPNQRYTFEDARADIDENWDQLVAAHPRLSRLKVHAALRQLFQRDPGTSPTSDVVSDVMHELNLKSAGGRAEAASLGARQPSAAAVDHPRRTTDIELPDEGGAAVARAKRDGLTSAQLQMVAARNGTTVEQERKRAEAEGFFVR